MIKVLSNSNDVFRDLTNRLQILRETDQVVRIAALDASVRITNRIQQKGLKSNESSIGQYSSSYTKRRNKMGRQTRIIDLTMTGDMFDNFTVAPSGRNEYEVGFRNKESGDKAEWMEARFGIIFSLSDQEFEENKKGIQEGVDAILR